MAAKRLMPKGTVTVDKIFELKCFSLLASGYVDVLN